MNRDNEEKQEDFSTSSTGHVEPLSQDISAFGRVQIDIERCLRRKAILKLARILKKFEKSERDALEGSETPQELFVKYSVEKELITAKGATPIIESLENLGIADQAREIRAIYGKYRQQLEAEILSSGTDSLRSWEDSNPSISHSSKRTLDDLFSDENDASLEGPPANSSAETREQGKLAKVTNQNFTDVTARKSQYVFIQQLVNPHFSEVDKNKARCIGVAFEISNSPPQPKLLYASTVAGEMVTRVNKQCYKLKKGSNILNRKCYMLSSCYGVTIGPIEGILIDPEAEASMISRRSPQFECINFQKLEADEPFTLPTGCDDGIYLPAFKVAFVKYSMPDGQTVFNISGIVKEMAETHFRSSPRITFKLIDDTSGVFLDISIFKQHVNSSWLDTLRENESVTLRYFKTHRSASFQSDTNMLVGNKDSSVELLGNDKFDELKEFDLGLSEEGEVMTVNPVRPYPACPDCYKKLDEHNRCPTCREVFSEEDLERQFLVKLEILVSKSQKTIDGLV